MRVRARHPTAVLLAMGVASGCADYPPLLNPDVLEVIVILEAGAQEEIMAVRHPHRSDDEAALWIVRDAVLRGPGWTVPFVDPLEECRASSGGPPGCARTGVELRAELPEPIAANATYVVEGEGVLGPFACTVEVPASPVLLDLPDTLRIPMDTAVFVPFRWEVGPEVGRLLLEGDVEFTSEFGVNSFKTSRWLAAKPNGRGTDSVFVDTRDPFGEGITGVVWLLHLGGLGWNREEFSRIPRELWHAQAAEAAGYDLGAGGVEGEEAYGYCDGMSYSRKWVIIAE